MEHLAKPAVGGSPVFARDGHRDATPPAVSDVLVDDEGRKMYPHGDGIVGRFAGVIPEGAAAHEADPAAVEVLVLTGAAAVVAALAAAPYRLDASQ